MKMTSGSEKMWLAGLIALGCVLHLMGAPVPGQAGTGSSARASMVESGSPVTPARRAAAGAAEVIPQWGSLKGTVQGKPALERRGIGEETFCAIVFPFFVILFTGAGVCVYLGAIAWLPALREEEVNAEGA